MLAPLGDCLHAFGAAVNRMSENALRADVLLLVRDGCGRFALVDLHGLHRCASIVQTFFITAIAFLGLSLWGYTTKRDISGWGSFLIMGVIGLIIAIDRQHGSWHRRR